MSETADRFEVPATITLPRASTATFSARAPFSCRVRTHSRVPEEPASTYLASSRRPLLPEAPAFA